jgi:hypothetical protein
MPDDIDCVKRIVLNESMGNSLKLLIQNYQFLSYQFLSYQFLSY